MAKQVRRTSDEKRRKLVEIRDQGAEIRQLTSHPAVVDWFEKEKRRRTACVVSASAKSGDELRIAGLELKALLELQQHLSLLRGFEDVAVLELSKMKDDDNG